MSPVSSPERAVGGSPGGGRNSMSLLTELMSGALDAGYTDAARRRAADGLPPRGLVTTRQAGLLTLGLVVVGLLLATAAVQTRNRAPAAAETRTQLVAEVQARTAATDRLARDLDQLRQQVDAARATGLALTSEGSAVAERLAALEAVTGAQAVHGPGITVHIAQPAQAGETPGDAGSEDGRVLDQDLQIVVNALWASGAEAVAVDGQRLTSLSAIRSAGEAVLVNYRPLSPPYDIVAIGPPDLEESFADSVGGRYLHALENYGITTKLSHSTDLHLPAASDLGLDQVRVTAAAPSPPASSTPTTGKATP